MAESWRGVSPIMQSFCVSAEATGIELRDANEIRLWQCFQEAFVYLETTPKCSHIHTVDWRKLFHPKGDCACFSPVSGILKHPCSQLPTCPGGKTDGFHVQNIRRQLKPVEPLYVQPNSPNKGSRAPTPSCLNWTRHNTSKAGEAPKRGGGGESFKVHKDGWVNCQCVQGRVTCKCVTSQRVELFSWLINCCTCCYRLLRAQGRSHKRRNTFPDVYILAQGPFCYQC